MFSVQTSPLNEHAFTPEWRESEEKADWYFKVSSLKPCAGTDWQSGWRVYKPLSSTIQNRLSWSCNAVETAWAFNLLCALQLQLFLCIYVYVCVSACEPTDDHIAHIKPVCSDNLGLSPMKYWALLPVPRCMHELLKCLCLWWNALTAQVPIPPHSLQEGTEEE